MGLYRIPTQEDIYIESICEECIQTYIDTGDELLAEDDLFQQQMMFNQMNDQHQQMLANDEMRRNQEFIDDMIRQQDELNRFTQDQNHFTSQQLDGVRNFLKRLDDIKEKDRRDFKKNHPNLYKLKIKSDKAIHDLSTFFQKQKDYFKKKLVRLNKWAEECKDNKQKSFISRLIAFIVRMIKKLTDKIRNLSLN